MKIPIHPDTYECFCRGTGMNSMSLPLSLLFLGVPRLFLLGPARVFFWQPRV